MSETLTDVMQSVQISPEVLESACRVLCRQVASQILAALSQYGFEPEYVDDKCGWKAGTTQRTISLLVRGRGGKSGLNFLADVACALDCTPRLYVTAKREVQS